MLRVGWLCVCVSLVPSLVAAQEAPPPIREITAIRDGLYRAREDGHITLFLVTDDGIVLADPLNAAFARWLKSELEVRYPTRPVRYVLYTGHAYERAAGAAVFDAKAEIIAHQGFVDARRSASQSLPNSWAPFDRNHDSIIERSEAAALGAEALKRDLNCDGQITAAEAWSDVLSPKKTFSTRQVIDIGGQRVELVHPGNGLGADATVVLFPAQRVLFAPAAARRLARAGRVHNRALSRSRANRETLSAEGVPITSPPRPPPSGTRSTRPIRARS